MIDFKTIADNADLIINGYAFTKSGDYIRVLNLNRLNKALVFDYNQEVIETSMDDIEIQIVFDYYNKNKKYMEVQPCLNIMNLVCGYYLYYTAHCIIEAMHVHASDKKLTESGSAKFFVKSNGDTTVERQGILSEREVRIIREFIKDNYKEMYLKWSELSDNGFFGE